MVLQSRPLLTRIATNIVYIAVYSLHSIVTNNKKNLQLITELEVGSQPWPTSGWAGGRWAGPLAYIPDQPQGRLGVGGRVLAHLRVGWEEVGGTTGSTVTHSVDGYSRLRIRNQAFQQFVRPYVRSIHLRNSKCLCRYSINVWLRFDKNNSRKSHYKYILSPVNKPFLLIQWIISLCLSANLLIGRSVIIP